jgi:ADP-heptose:LPS heptosyltransferase
VMPPDSFQGRTAQPDTGLRRLRLYAFLLLDSLCKLVPAPRKPVAVIVRLDAIGDFFMWMQSGAVDISAHVRDSRRRAVLLANSVWADYARRTGLWDEVVALEPKRLMTNPWYRLRCLIRIRKLGAQLLIQPRPARILLQEDAIARVCGAACRVGNTGTRINMSTSLRALGNRFYDRLIRVDEDTAVHETARNHQFVQALTGRPPTAYEFPTVSGEARNRIVVALGAGESGRVWPVDKLARLVEHLRSKHRGMQIALLGLGRDLPAAQRLTELLGGDIDNRVGTTSLDQYVALIASSLLVICNDSSAYHIAMAYRRTVLCFLGGGHYGWFAPYPSSNDSRARAIVLSVPMDCFWCNWHCKYPRSEQGALRCVASISVEAAIAAAEGLLAH